MALGIKIVMIAGNGRGKPTASSLSADGFPPWPVQISNHRMAIRM